jgi:ABC-2 type transport system permease protein
MQEKAAHWNFISKALDNPIISKEIKGRMRGRQGYILLTVYLAALSLAIAAVYYFATKNEPWASPDRLADLGKQIFGLTILLEFALITIIGPALTSGSISSEKERRTFDLLRTSLISTRELILGKLGATVAFLLLLILAALPLQSLAFFLGGIGWEELAISLVMLTTSTLMFCTLGIYFSGIAKRTAAATAISYAILLIPVVAGFILYLMLDNNVIDLSAHASIEYQRAMLVIFWVLLSSNPFTAAIVTELMLEEEQSLALIVLPNDWLVLLSPWIIYTVFSVIMTVLMIRLIVFYMNRYQR